MLRGLERAADRVVVGQRRLRRAAAAQRREDAAVALEGVADGRRPGVAVLAVRGRVGPRVAARGGLQIPAARVAGPRDAVRERRRDDAAAPLLEERGPGVVARGGERRRRRESKEARGPDFQPQETETRLGWAKIFPIPTN